jgi:MOSC domain-containing protein YiiM
MQVVRHLTAAELEAGLAEIRQSPSDAGILRLIVRRPAPGEREEMQQGTLDSAAGLVGDYWGTGRRPNVDCQITLMNARAIALIADFPSRWSLAGDQLYVDLDLSSSNLPPGTRLTIGTATVEITAVPHTGCRIFRGHYGGDAMRFVNSPMGRELNLRGVNARVLRNGPIMVGDTIKRVR